MESLPSSVLEVNKFWQTTAYNISGYVFSLDDIEHGILRGGYINKFWQTTAYNISGYVFSLDDIEHGILRGGYKVIEYGILRVYQQVLADDRVQHIWLRVLVG